MIAVLIFQSYRTEHQYENPLKILCAMGKTDAIIKFLSYIMLKVTREKENIIKNDFSNTFSGSQFYKK